MVDADERQAGREREPLRVRDAHDERADEPRAVRDRDRVEVGAGRQPAPRSSASSTTPTIGLGVLARARSRARRRRSARGSRSGSRRRSTAARGRRASRPRRSRRTTSRSRARASSAPCAERLLAAESRRRARSAAAATPRRESEVAGPHDDGVLAGVLVVARALRPTSVKPADLVERRSPPRSTAAPRASGACDPARDAPPRRARASSARPSPRAAASSRTARFIR